MNRAIGSVPRNLKLMTGIARSGCKKIRQGSALLRDGKQLRC